MMEKESLGRIYEDGEILITKGETGDCMHVIQEGQVEVYLESEGKEIRLAVRGEGEFIGAMAIFERETRSANVRALGQVRVLTVDKKNLFRRIQEDPSMAFRLVQTMSSRIRELSNEIARLKGTE